MNKLFSWRWFLLWTSMHSIPATQRLLFFCPFQVDCVDGLPWWQQNYNHSYAMMRCCYTVSWHFQCLQQCVLLYWNGLYTLNTSSAPPTNRQYDECLEFLFFFSFFPSCLLNFVSTSSNIPRSWFNDKKMQTSMYDDEPQSIFVFRNPLRFLSRKGRQIGAYLSGGLVSGCTGNTSWRL